MERTSDYGASTRRRAASYAVARTVHSTAVVRRQRTISTLRLPGAPSTVSPSASTQWPRRCDLFCRRRRSRRVARAQWPCSGLALLERQIHRGSARCRARRSRYVGGQLRPAVALSCLHPRTEGCPPVRTMQMPILMDIHRDASNPQRVMTDHHSCAGDSSVVWAIHANPSFSTTSLDKTKKWLQPTVNCRSLVTRTKWTADSEPNLQPKTEQGPVEKS